MTLLRSIGADLPLDRWLSEKIFPLEDKLNKDWAFSGTLLGIAEMLRSGVTSFSDMYFFGESRANAVLETGINAIFLWVYYVLMIVLLKKYLWYKKIKTYFKPIIMQIVDN